MRKKPFVAGEYYHVYNRGVDKRNIFSDQNDVQRFLQSMREFNTKEPIGSIYENSFVKPQLGRETSKLPKLGKLPKSNQKLVDFIAYCLNPNHFHFILRPLSDNGLSEFIKRLAGGYTKFFNNKSNRLGVLFQGVFKSIHVNSNKYLLYLSAYVNLNNEVHQLGNETSKSSKLVRNSFNEYINNEPGFCTKEIILEQFNSKKEYGIFVKEVVGEIAKRRKEDKDFEKLLLE